MNHPNEKEKCREQEPVVVSDCCCVEEVDVLVYFLVGCVFRIAFVR